VFLDAGNVWLLKKDEARPGGNFTWSTFGRDIALGTGVGVRLDMTYIVLRFDVGVPLHDPYDTGKSGYYNVTKVWKELGYHLAIGYPF
jgi:outer membrane protein assembly factor BamA